VRQRVRKEVFFPEVDSLQAWSFYSSLVLPEMSLRSLSPLLSATVLLMTGPYAKSHAGEMKNESHSVALAGRIYLLCADNTKALVRKCG